MLDAIASLAGTLVSVLQSLQLSKRKKRALGKHLLRIHVDLSTLAANGDAILRRISRYWRTGHIDIQSVIRLLGEQQMLISRIQSTLRRRGCREILGIRVPTISPLYVELGMKANRIAVHLSRAKEPSEFERGPRRRSDYEPAELISLLTYEHARFTAPPKDEVRQARSAIRLIKQHTEALRQAIASSFDVENLL